MSVRVERAFDFEFHGGRKKYRTVCDDCGTLTKGWVLYAKRAAERLAERHREEHMQLEDWESG